METSEGGIRFRLRGFAARVKAWSARLSAALEPNQENRWVIFFQNLKVAEIEEALRSYIPWMIRWFWVTCLTVLMGFCAHLVYIDIIEYVAHPVMLYIEPLNQRPQDVYFPATTVCNLNYISKSKALEAISMFDQAKEFGTVTRHGVIWSFKNTVELLTHTDHGCNYKRSFIKTSGHDFKYDNLKDGNQLGLRDSAEWIERYNMRLNRSDTYIKKIKPFLEEGFQGCDHLAPVCEWEGSGSGQCAGSWESVLTDAGWCCVFNMNPNALLKRNLDAGAVDVMKSTSVENPKVPRRQMMPGKFSGLTVILNPGKIEESYCSSHDGTGFLFAVHSNDEIANMGSNGEFIKLGVEVLASITVEVYQADSGLSSVPLKKRGCCLDEDSCPVEHFAVYTQDNCLAECLAKVTKDECQCIMSHMPGSETATLCGPSDYACVDRVKDILNRNGSDQNCSHCLPRCNRPTFGVHTTDTEIQTFYKNWNTTNAEWTKNNVTIFRAFINSSPIKVMSLQRVYNFWTFFGIIGGTIGLCLDWNIPMIIRFIYATFCAMFGYKINGDETEEKKKPHISDFRGYLWLFSRRTVIDPNQPIVTPATPTDNPAIIIPEDNPINPAPNQPTIPADDLDSGLITPEDNHTDPTDNGPTLPADDSTNNQIIPEDFEPTTPTPLDDSRHNNPNNPGALTKDKISISYFRRFLGLFSKQSINNDSDKTVVNPTTPGDDGPNNPEIPEATIPSTSAQESTNDPTNPEETSGNSPIHPTVNNLIVPTPSSSNSPNNLITTAVTNLNPKTYQKICPYFGLITCNVDPNAHSTSAMNAAIPPIDDISVLNVTAPNIPVKKEKSKMTKKARMISRFRQFQQIFGTPGDPNAKDSDILSVKSFGTASTDPSATDVDHTVINMEDASKSSGSGEAEAFVTPMEDTSGLNLGVEEDQADVDREPREPTLSRKSSKLQTLRRFIRRKSDSTDSVCFEMSEMTSPLLQVQPISNDSSPEPSSSEITRVTRGTK